MEGKANFAYMEEVTNTALLQEARSPTLPQSSIEKSKQKGLRLVAGLEVFDDSIVQKSIAGSIGARKTKANAFFTDRDEVIAKLKKLGVVPLAVVPKAPWEQICDNAGLYRLAPGSENEVAVSNEGVLASIEARTSAIMTAVFLLLVASPALMAAWAGWNFANQSAPSTNMLMWLLDCVPAIIAGGAAAVVSFLVTAVIFGAFSDSPWSERLLNEVQLRAYDRTPKSKLLDAYFPGHIEPDSSDFTAHLVLPLPPQEVATALLKAQSLALKVAAVGDAISFTETPSQVLRKEHARRAQIRAEQRAAWLSDPIVYFEHKSAVAIIAQFGDFPIEKEAVDKAVFSEFLL